jgi:hypothetical protein
MEMRSERIALDKIYKRRGRYEIPDWQRDQVWGPDKQEKLIDSILRGWKLPKFYLQKTGSEPDTFDVVDGQQRLSSIWGFFDGTVKLSAKLAAEFGGDTYSSLPDVLSDKFDDYEIEYDVISATSDEDVKEFFQRLQAGLQLNSGEKLNSIHSNLRDFAAELAKHKFFTESTTVANKRHSYFDISAKVLTLEIEGLESGLRFDDISTVFKTNAGFSNTSRVAEDARASLDLLYSIFPSKNNILRQRSMIQSLITLACYLRRAGMNPAHAIILKEFIESFSSELQRQVELGLSATDPDYIAFQRTVNANVKSGAKQRHEILLHKLFAQHPTFYTSASKSEELETALAAGSKRYAEQIRKLIEAANEAYAAKNGSDLFKATNKTVSALTSLDTHLGSVEDYKSWIDGLYFVFREAIGQRLDGSLPQSFVDVNTLRTSMQHDVDHGKGAASKRKKLSAAFSKYSGFPTPDSVTPERFGLMQSNLLRALATDMETLFKSLSAQTADATA